MSFTSYLSNLLGSRLPIAPMPVAPTIPSPQLLEAFTATAELVPTQGEAVVHTPTGSKPSLWNRFVAAVMGVKATITSFFARTPDHSPVHGLRDMTVEVIAAPALARPSQERVEECVAAAVHAAFAGCDDYDKIVATAISQASSMAARSLRLSHAPAFESGHLTEAVVSQAVAKATKSMYDILYVPSVEALSRQSALVRKQGAHRAAIDAADADRQRATDTGAASRTQATSQAEAMNATPSLAEQEADFERLYARALELEDQLKARDSEAAGKQ